MNKFKPELKSSGLNLLNWKEYAGEMWNFIYRWPLFETKGRTKKLKKSLDYAVLISEQLPISDVKQIRPWVRYWARLIDINVGNVLVGLFGIFIPQAVKWGILFTAFMTITFSILLEALLLSTWGMTLGKSLFQVFVRNSQGEKLTFLQAIKRCISVWGWGLGFGIPVASFILMGMSYQYIEEKGVAKWDMGGETQVSHKRIGIPRIAVILLFSIGFFGLHSLN